MEIFENIGWVALFALIASLVGFILILVATALVPKILDKLSPSLDEQKEIARGNRAVAEYFGRIVAACIVGISIVVASAVFVSMMTVFK